MMFVAKFGIAQGDKFTADRNGNMPYIGTIVAGKAHTSIINGTIAQNEGIVPNKMYLCMEQQVELANQSTGEITKVWNIVVLSEVSPIDAVKMMKDLGAGVRIAATADVAATVDNSAVV